MNTETRLYIRRAKPLDAVNLYRLLVDEEKRAGTEVPYDEAARLAHVLTVIETGYVSVAVLSGRIIGSIGAVPSALRYVKELSLAGEWLVILPSFRDTPVGRKLVEGLVRFADLHKFDVQFMLPYPVGPAAAKAAGENGFELSAVMYRREQKVDETPPAENDTPVPEPEAQDADDFPPDF